jgi:hypothetical protein
MSKNLFRKWLAKKLSPELALTERRFWRLRSELSAVAEAGRMNAFDKYRHQFLMVDLAAFVSAGRKARSHHPDGSARGR